MDISPEQQQEIWENQKIKPMPARTYAKKALKAVSRNQAIVVIPFWWHFLWWIDRLSPNLGIWLAQLAHKMMQDFTTNNGEGGVRG